MEELEKREHLIRKMSATLDEAKINLLLGDCHFDLCGRIEACLMEWEHMQKVTQS